jgi:hypothetical protein
VIISPPGTQSVAIGEPVTLSVTVNGGVPPYLFQWARDSQILAITVAGTTNNYFTFIASAVPITESYQVTVKNSGSTSGNSVGASATITTVADSDGDGLPDLWETQHGFLVNDPSDANLDSDNDGFTNLHEYKAGTDPNNASSFLHLDLIPIGGTVLLRFHAASNKTYSLEYVDSLEQLQWKRLWDIPATQLGRLETFSDSPNSSRFYRVITPRLP